jgi:hypothetical protein
VVKVFCTSGRCDALRGEGWPALGGAGDLGGGKEQGLCKRGFGAPWRRPMGRSLVL